MAFKITKICEQILKEIIFQVNGLWLVYNLMSIALNLHQTLPKMTIKDI